MSELTENDLLTRLRNPEDTFVERKTIADGRDWLKTVVAFANSTPVGHPAVLFIGAKNDGTIEAHTQDLDSLQKKFSSRIKDKAFPPVYYLFKVIGDSGKQCLAVIVPGSENRPHFSGQSYVREGSKTVVASQPQFDRLIAERQAKPYKILRWKGKYVSVHYMNPGGRQIMMIGPIASRDQLTV